MARFKQQLIALAAVAFFAATTPALAQSSGGDWRQTIFLYGMGAMIEGDAQVGPLQVPVDVDLSDFFDVLKFGGMAAYRVENDDWSFTGDATYMNLGGNKVTQQSRASAGLDVEQMTVMVTAGRRILPHLEALLSLAYFDVDADLRVRLLQQVRTAGREASWVDPLIGLNYEVPVGRKWRYTLRGDIGGGLDSGADLTWHALTKFTYQNSERFGWYVGYRVISYDYEDGQGLNYQHYDLRQHGPGLGVSISF
jgi:hypothetical protein